MRWLRAAVLPFMLAAACSGGATEGAADASATSGETLFRRCAACHSVEAAGPQKLGPNLHGVFGRKAATLKAFRYSPAMAASGLTWDEATLDRFLAAPAKAVPGTKMSFSGLKEPAQRRAVIDYLRREAAR